MSLRVSSFSQDTGALGINFESDGNSVSAVLVSNANVTNGISRGLFLLAGGSSNLKARVTNSRWLGNFQGFSFSGVQNSVIAGRIQGNNSDSYELIRGNSSLFQVENLVNFANENIGTLNSSAGITSAALDSLGIPN